MTQPRFLIHFFVLLFVVVVNESRASDAPVVLSTNPPNEAKDVTPGLAELEVVFDRPMMDGSWSWCGGGITFPTANGQPSYRDDRTAIYPALLLPQHTYFLAINCDDYDGFKSADGVAAAPVPWTFTTGGDVPVLDDVLALHREALTELQRLIAVEYSYAARTGTDWNALFAAEEPWLLQSPTPQEFGIRLARVLRAADDLHMSVVLPDGTQMGTGTRTRTRNSDRGAIRERFSFLRSPHSRVHFMRDGDVGYLAITSWRADQEFRDAIDAAMAELYDVPTLIIDVRDNGGGDENSASRLASWFVEKPRVYAHHRFRDAESPTGWTEVRKRWIGPSNDPYQTFEGERVFVLQGEFCLSSNEAFLLMMRQCDRATTVGETSGGSSANPGRFDLAAGLQVVLPRWEAMDADRRVIEGAGIEPDVPVEWGDANSRGGRDVVLERALELAAEAAPAVDATE